MTAPATTQPAHEHQAEDRLRPAPRHDDSRHDGPRHDGPRHDDSRHDDSRHDAPAGRREAPAALPGAAPGPVPPGPGALAPRLLDVLRCPLTGGTLIPLDVERLMSDRPFRDGVHPVYPVVRGIACLASAR